MILIIIIIFYQQHFVYVACQLKLMVYVDYKNLNGYILLFVVYLVAEEMIEKKLINFEYNDVYCFFNIIMTDKRVLMVIGSTDLE